MTRLSATARAGAAAVALAAGAVALAQAPAIRITSPTDGTYVTGVARLTLVTDPLSAIRNVDQVRWFADGRLVCTATRAPFSCDWDAGPGITEHQIRAVALFRNGERQIDNVRTAAAEYAEIVEVDVVQITAVVTDREGRFVSGLRPEDFRILDDDRPQTLSHFASENIPLELVAAIDFSSSMTDAIPTVKAAAKQFLGDLEPTDQVTLLGFNDNIFTLARRSAEPAVRAKALDRVAPWGGTALYDVLLMSMDVLGRQAGRHAVVVFTDGEDQSSRAPIETVIRRAEGSDATIYMIGQGRALRATSLQQLMRHLTSVSGGRAFFTEGADKLEAAFHEIIEDLRHQYLLSYAPPTGASDGGWHRIKVEAGGGKYSVRTRQGYRIEHKKSH
jgi:Ca-activated chloride channel homolog